jgi:putative spermidine/putrescine transport system substrate-binding protein
MKRRELLQQLWRLSPALALGGPLSLGLSSCAPPPGQNQLLIRLLLGSIPQPLLKEFERFVQAQPQPIRPMALNVSSEPQLQQLFDLLQAWKLRQIKPSQPDWRENLPILGDRGRSRLPDLVSLGDGWLETAIRQQLIQPFEAQSLQQLAGWSTLPAPWVTWLKRGPDGQPSPQGEIWGVPYRMGTQVLLYRQDLLKQRQLPPPQDWHDLWRPDLRDRISLPGQAREVIGLVLKKLGRSYNEPNIAGIGELEPELKALHQQAKLYSSAAYLQPLSLGDTWVAVANGSDALTAMQRNANLAAVLPKSGTALWADLWVRPRGQTAPAPLLQAWLQFCWQPSTAEQIARLSRATGPGLLLPGALQPKLDHADLLFPPPEILGKSEFIHPLRSTAIAAYQTLWQRVTG